MLSATVSPVPLVFRRLALKYVFDRAGYLIKGRLKMFPREMIPCAMNTRRRGIGFFPPSFPRVFPFFLFSAFPRINSSWEIKSMILWVFITYSMGEVGNGIGFVMDDDQRVCDALYFCWFFFFFYAVWNYDGSKAFMVI